jgi:hypothetical protein
MCFLWGRNWVRVQQTGFLIRGLSRRSAVLTRMRPTNVLPYPWLVTKVCSPHTHASNKRATLSVACHAVLQSSHACVQQTCFLIRGLSSRSAVLTRMRPTNVLPYPWPVTQVCSPHTHASNKRASLSVACHAGLQASRGCVQQTCFHIRGLSRSSAGPTRVRQGAGAEFGANNTQAP